MTLVDSRITVCENAFLVILGLAGQLDDRKPKMWESVKRKLRIPQDELIGERSDKQQFANNRYAPQQEHALVWLHEAARNSSDFSVNADQDKMTVPYSSASEMWREYVEDHKEVSTVVIHVYVNEFIDVATYTSLLRLLQIN